MILLLSGGAAAQESRSEVSVQGTGFFTKDSNGQGVLQQGTDTGGVLATYRYRLNHWLSAEGAYGWNRNSQLFFAPGAFSRIQSDVHQATGGIVINLPAPRLYWINPYVLAEGGALIFNPTNNIFGTVPGAQRDSEGLFVYGAGADLSNPAFKHFALRVEYRGLVYHAPNFGLRNINTDTLTHTAMPSAGIVFRF